MQRFRQKRENRFERQDKKDYCCGVACDSSPTAAKTKQSYDDAKKLVTENVKPSKTDSDDGEQTKPEIPVDFTALQEKNPDIYAWIKIDGTTVDYPVCQNNKDDW